MTNSILKLILLNQLIRVQKHIVATRQSHSATSIMKQHFFKSAKQQQVDFIMQ